MSTFEVRFIKEPSDPDDAHIKVTIDAADHEEAFKVARTTVANNGTWLATYDFYSVEVTRF